MHIRIPNDVNTSPHILGNFFSLPFVFAQDPDSVFGKLLDPDPPRSPDLNSKTSVVIWLIQ